MAAWPGCAFILRTAPIASSTAGPAWANCIGTATDLPPPCRSVRSRTRKHRYRHPGAKPKDLLFVIPRKSQQQVLRCARDDRCCDGWVVMGESGRSRTTGSRPFERRARKRRSVVLGRSRRTCFFVIPRKSQQQVLRCAQDDRCCDGWVVMGENGRSRTTGSRPFERRARKRRSVILRRSRRTCFFVIPRKSQQQVLRCAQDDSCCDWWAVMDSNHRPAD